MKRYFAPSMGMTLVTLILIPTFIALGVWQLHRAEYKSHLKHLYQQRQHSLPISWKQLIILKDDFTYVPIIIKGHYDEAHSILLDNKISQHRIGYQVLTPFFPMNSHQAILINRGWIPKGDHYRAIPLIATPSSYQVLKGLLAMPSKNAFILGKNIESELQWPLRAQRIDVPIFSRILGYSLHPNVVLLSPSSSSGFMREWEPLSLNEHVHRGYAIQWFAFALVLAMIFMGTSLKRKI